MPMRKASVLLSLALLVATTFSCPQLCWADESPASRTIEEVAEEAKKAVVVITQMGRDGRREGVGTGFVLDSEGLIATNLHVIGEGRAIRVRLANGKNHPVQAIHASDRHQDLAILKIDASGLESLPLGEPEALRPGSTVVAVGNPHGLAHSVVSGVVSAKRDVDGRPMIQVAIPIEPGNSGGPLLDLKGRVHGLLTMKSLVTENLGFAIPIEALKPLLEKPNPVPMDRWLVLGSLSPHDWLPLFGANWRQRAGRLIVDGMGSGFGGRSLCLWQRPLPGATFEMAVKVKLDDESGAAGLVFCSDGDQRHYAFYPSGGRLRLSRFEGPDINSWTILREIATDSYRPGEWNLLAVKYCDDRIVCTVNGETIIESNDKALTNGSVGLAKFRDTKAEFKQFQVAKSIETAEISPETHALIDQLLDGSSRSQSEAIAKLTQANPTVVDALRERAALLERQAKMLREAATDLHQHRVEAELKELISEPEEEIDLLRGALLIARLDNDELDIDAYVRRVDEMAEDVRSRMEGADPTDQLAVLDTYLFEEMGFHGSRSDYYNRANSYLSQVIEDREGLPITLSVLYMELARRLGIDVAGIGLPGHFVVRLRTDEGEEPLIDVFDRGTRISVREAEQRVLGTTGRPLEDQELSPMSKRAILGRMVQNLFGIVQQKGDIAGMLRYLGATIAVVPENAQAHLMRGILLVQTNRSRDALVELDWLLENEPEGIDLEKVEQFREMILRQ